MDRLVARTTEMVVEELDGGLVIYDERAARAHWLDPDAAAVWRACSEPVTADEIFAESALDAPQGETVLAELIDLGLVETQSGSGYSRRSMLVTAAKVGIGGAVAAPIITAVIPVAAAHASTGGGTPQPPPVPGTLSDYTYGYWKNNGYGTIPLTSISLGTYAVTTWPEVSNILNDHACGKGNELNCLAAHLLGAELDVAGGGLQPTCLAPLMNQATGLLESYHYSGPGTYSVWATDATTITNTLVPAFDRYAKSKGANC